MQGDSALGRALALVRDLRARCPWDGAQTRASLRPYLVEEVLELDQAIADGDTAELRDELGDMLLHLAFQIVIGEEKHEFDAETVTAGLEAKMHRRHPHLFGMGEKPETWELGKRGKGEGGRGNAERGARNAERKAVGRTLAGLPPSLPRLLMAYRLQERAAGVGFDWPDATGPLKKVVEETTELVKEMASGQREALEDEVGDLLFAVVNLARKLEVDPRAALERANAKFARRFSAVEKLAEERGLELGRASLEDLDRLWDEVKGR